MATKRDLVEAHQFSRRRLITAFLLFTVVDAALVGVDAVCHQAAKVGLGVDFQDAPDYVDSNEHGTAVLLAAMDRAGVDRLVVASSMAYASTVAITVPSSDFESRNRFSKRRSVGTSVPSSHCCDGASRLMKSLKAAA